MTTPDIQSLVESVLRLDKEATKGPWDALGYGFGSQGNGGDVGFCHGFQDGSEEEEERSGCANAALIATYRTAAPILARACNEKDAEIAHLRAELAEEKRKVEVAKNLIGKLFTRKTDDLGFYYVSNNMGGINSELSHEIEAALTTPSEKG